MKKDSQKLDYVVLSVILFLVYLVMLLLAMGCSTNKIAYTQKEIRLFKKTDSLNLKIEPSEIIKNERRWHN